MTRDTGTRIRLVRPARLIRLLIALATVVTLVAACGGDDDTPPTTIPAAEATVTSASAMTPESSSTATSAITAATETRAVTATTTRAATVPPATQAPATPAGTTTSIPVGAGPFGIVSGAGSLWVPNLNDGTLIRIDPATNTVVATIDIGATPVDPATMISPPMAVAATDTDIWVTRSVAGSGGAATTHELLRLDPATNEIVATIPLEFALNFLAATDDAVWIISREDNVVIRVDIATNQVVSAIAVDGPWWIVATDDAIWVDNGPTANSSIGQVERWMTEIDPATNAIVDRFAIDQTTVWFAVDAGSLWVPNMTTNEVLRIDPETYEVIARIKVTLPGPTVAADGAVWVQNGSLRTLVQIDQETNTVVASYRSAGVGGPIAWLDGAIWIAEMDTSQVVRVDP